MDALKKDIAIKSRANRTIEEILLAWSPYPKTQKRLKQEYAILKRNQGRSTAKSN